MLAKVGELVLPAIEGSGPIEAWIIDVASTVSVRETDTGKELHRYRLPLGVGQVAFAPDGKTLAALEDWNDDGGVRESALEGLSRLGGPLQNETVIERVAALFVTPRRRRLSTVS